MADNTIINQPVTIGQSIATKDIGGVNHELVLLEFDDGAGGASEVSALKPLPVTDAQVLAKLIVGIDVSNFPATQTDALTDAQLRAVAVAVTGTFFQAIQPVSNTYLSNQSGTWGYNAGVSGTLTLTGSKRVLKITAIALELAGSFTINGGDVIVIPYGSTDKVSSSIEFEPMGNVVDPVIVFSNTKAYMVEWVS